MTVLAMDVGGSAVKYALCDLQGNLTEYGKHKGMPAPVAPAPYEEFLSILQGIVRQFAGRIEGIAVSMPGCIDSKRGYCLSGGALSFNAGHYLARDLMEFAGMPCVIENDGKAAARAELWHGSMRGVDSGYVLALGTGVAGGLILDGKVYPGFSGAAGEVSFINASDEHLHKEEYGYLSGARYSATGLLTLAAQELGLPYSNNFNTGIKMPLDGEEFFRRVKQGDARMLKVLQTFGLRLGHLIFNLACVTAPQRVAIGGGISVQESVIEAIRAGLEEVYEHHTVPRQYNVIAKPEVVPCTFHNEANLLGAVHCLSQYFPQFALQQDA